MPEPKRVWGFDKPTWTSVRIYPLTDIDGGDTPFPLPFEEFKLALLREREVLAKDRCAEALSEVEAREDDPRDQTFDSSGNPK